ncbi:pyruvate kinase [Methanomicrobium sp. W14]|uniref:hypothetical protein n=1 Tax=Methanomicrobium sp. W14 TaxID=2817839 RepID=UPI001AE138EC|nr:hypothetical protein [Methanomicrobium sp. W14]MBP2132669.1 pyruvate kinase [Methanomicrobium sp. W14]
MGYRWKNKIDVDEAVVVLMNSLDAEGKLPAWLVRTMKQSLADSEKEMGSYFMEEIKVHAPRALPYFLEES